MSLSRFLGSYYKLPKSDSNAVYLLPNAVYLLQCCFIAANIVWAGQCDNSLFPWKLYKINLTAQQTINTAIKISVNVNWCYSTPRLFCKYCRDPEINMQRCYRILVSLKSWPGLILSLNPCLRPKILAWMLFLGIMSLKVV